MRAFDRSQSRPVEGGDSHAWSAANGLHCSGCSKRFWSASPDAIVASDARCTACGGALIHSGVREPLPLG